MSKRSPLALLAAVPAVLLTLALWIAIGLLTVVLSLAILLVNLLLGAFDRKRRIAHRIASLWGRGSLLCNPCWRLTITGRHHIPARRPVIFVSNHQSMLDIMAGFCLFRQFKWVAKEELFRIPFLGWAMAGARYIRLARGERGSIRQSYDEAGRWLASGVSVFFFPEGTRSRTGQLGPFKNGAFKLALDTGVPIVPIVITGTRGLLQRGGWLFNPTADVRIAVLPPVQPSTDHADPDRLRDHVRDLIARTLQQQAASAR